MRKLEVQKMYSRSCSDTFFIWCMSKVPLPLYFAFFVLRQRSLAMFAGSGIRWYGLGAMADATFFKLANEKCWD